MVHRNICIYIYIIIFFYEIYGPSKYIYIYIIIFFEDFFTSPVRSKYWSLFLLFSVCGPPKRQNKRDNKFFFFFFVNTRFGFLEGIFSKSLKGLCVSFSKTDSGLCVFHLEVQTNCNLLHNSLWITVLNNYAKSFIIILFI